MATERGELPVNWQEMLPAELTSLPLWRLNERIFISRRIQPVMIVSGLETDRVLDVPIDQRPWEELVGDLTTGNFDAILTGPAGQEHEVEGYLLSFLADANVADRVLTARYIPAGRTVVPTVALNIDGVDTITLSAGQRGYFWIPRFSPTWWTDDNGTGALSVNNPLWPFILHAGDIIALVATNRQVADLGQVSVMARRQN